MLRVPIQFGALFYQGIHIRHSHIDLRPAFRHLFRGCGLVQVKRIIIIYGNPQQVC